MKKIIFYKIAMLIVMALSVVSCSPSESMIQTSIVNTQEALPSSTPTLIPSSTSTPEPTITPTFTATPTPIPLSKINLDEILLIEGDLPKGFNLEPIGRYTNNPVLEDITGYEQLVIQEFSKTNEGIGVVAVFLFEETTHRDKAYNIAKKNLDGMENTFGTSKQTPIQDIGEKGIYDFENLIGNITIAKIIFVRCNAFVYMARSMDVEHSSVLRAYAKRLDSRLSEILCP